MPFYLYECTNDKCGHHQEEFRAISKRDEPATCEQCELVMKRIFHPDAGRIVMWNDPQVEGLTSAGPTRANKYTVKDVANAKNWWDKWGIKQP